MFEASKLKDECEVCHRSVRNVDMESGKSRCVASNFCLQIVPCTMRETALQDMDNNLLSLSVVRLSHP